MRHHRQYSVTKHHWGYYLICLLLQSSVAMFSSLHLMVSGWCSLHASTSPWAFLPSQWPISPSAAGETTVHTFTTLLLLVGGACYLQYPLICFPLHWKKFNVIVHILSERQSGSTSKIWRNYPCNAIRCLDENDILYIYRKDDILKYWPWKFQCELSLAYCCVKLQWI